MIRSPHAEVVGTCERGARGVSCLHAEDPMDDQVCEVDDLHGGSFLVGGGLAEVSTSCYGPSRGLRPAGELPTIQGLLRAGFRRKLSAGVLRRWSSRNSKPDPSGDR